MKSRAAATLFVLCAFIAGCVIGVARPWPSLGEERITLTSLSPDDAIRVLLVDLPQLDRNFELRLQRLSGGPTQTIFRSPDEGRPEGSERIIWSLDGSRFLLVGRHFYVHEGTPVANGESLYLMHDVRSGKTWCNAAQEAALPRFSAEDVSRIEWRGWEPRPPTPGSSPITPQRPHNPT